MDRLSPKRARIMPSLLESGEIKVASALCGVVGTIGQLGFLMSLPSDGKSARRRQIKRARQLAQEAAEIRAEKVAAAQRALQEGTLTLNSADLADALMRHLCPPSDTLSHR